MNYSAADLLSVKGCVFLTRLNQLLGVYCRLYTLYRMPGLQLLDSTTVTQQVGHMHFSITHQVSHMHFTITHQVGHMHFPMDVYIL